jgi:hypothetical protein
MRRTRLGTSRDHSIVFKGNKMQMFSCKERENQAGDSVDHRLLTLEECNEASGGGFVEKLAPQLKG